MPTHQSTKPLRTARLLLRPFTVDDADAMYANWASDPAVTRYLSWEPHANVDVTRAILMEWSALYDREDYYHWTITLHGEPIGSVGAVAMSSRDEWAEIGYCIGRAHWGQGIMTEVLQRLLAFFFEDVGLHRVCLRHDIDNIGSGRVMEKNGLTPEGVLRGQHRRRDGTWGDVRVYGILREEWIAREKKE